MFEPMNFEEMNEADVREEILAPLLRELGYRAGGLDNIIREQSLRYPHIFLGREDAKKDPLLRGETDYILVAGGKVRWVIEAKSPDTELGHDEIEQAWTYANHPEVRAVYFALCNGKRLDVFQTHMGPAANPILHLDYEALCEPDGAQKVKNLLSPATILRNHPEQKIDIGPPLGPGLRSVARITGGMIHYESNSLNHPGLNEVRNGIAEGSVERDEQGRLVAFLRTAAPTRSLQELNERLGFAAFEMISNDRALSTDPDQPSVFVYDHAFVLPAGEELLDLSTWRRIKLPVDIHTHVAQRAAGVLRGRQFAGKFDTELDFGQHMKVHMTGSFTVHLA
jgi:hypothetical protein